MSAEDYIREIAPAVARRRVRRGYLWLLQKTGGFYVPLWAQNPRLFIPKQNGGWQTEHLLAQVFTNAGVEIRSTNKKQLREFISIHINRQVRYDEVVDRFLLSPQFLLAHGFEPDDIITTALLNFVWHEAIWNLDYHSEFSDRWVTRDRKREPRAVSH